jgi:hypothetical protein
MVTCPVCNNEVDWVTREQAAQLLGVTAARVTQFIKSGRLPGSVKFQPHSNMHAFWKVPIESLRALIEFRRHEQGLEPLNVATRN